METERERERERESEREREKEEETSLRGKILRKLRRTPAKDRGCVAREVRGWMLPPSW